jgi:hypothetical protein
MNAPSRALFVATAVLTATLAAVGCAPATEEIAATRTQTPAATAAPTAIPTATPVAAAPTATPVAAPTAATGMLADGEPAPLEPGRYTISGRHFGVPASLEGTYPGLSFTLPAGWSGNSTLVGKTAGSSDEPLPGLFAWNFDHGFKNPCTDHTPVVPAAGSGASGLLRVIAGEPGIDAGPVTDVTVGGHDGAYVEYTVTTDRTTCGNGEDQLWIWGSCPPPVTLGCEGLTGDARYGANKDDRERAYAIDVDGTLYTFFTARPADLLAADRAEFQQFLDSIEFGPAARPAARVEAPAPNPTLEPEAVRKAAAAEFLAAGVANVQAFRALPGNDKQLYRGEAEIWGQYAAALKELQVPGADTRLGADIPGPAARSDPDADLRSALGAEAPGTALSRPATSQSEIRRRASGRPRL